MDGFQGGAELCQSNILLPVVSVSPHYVPVLVFADRLETHWKRNRGFYVASWSGSPRDRWFNFDRRGNKTAFLGALVCIDGDKGTVGFTNGRHRTRWLLQSGQGVIPVCVLPEEFDRWVDYHLLASDTSGLVALDLGQYKPK